MRALIVYESMFGATRTIAEAIAEGLAPAAEVRVVRAADAAAQVSREDLDAIDLLVVGGPTHAWSMSRPGTRRGAPGYVSKPDSGLTLEPGADTGPGVREWLATLPRLACRGAAFDTRIRMSPLVTGRASKAIARALGRQGIHLEVPPESFLVDKRSHLLASEPERARTWGAGLAGRISAIPFA